MPPVDYVFYFAIAPGGDQILAPVAHEGGG